MASSFQAALRTLLQGLQQCDEVLSTERLSAYYAHFCERFGPEALASRDGPALLDRMHGRGEARNNRLTYWLEFKDDDEVPGDRIGGIGGGAS